MLARYAFKLLNWSGQLQWASIFTQSSLRFSDLLESLEQNGKPPDENCSSANGDGPGMRHRHHREEADGPGQGPGQGPGDPGKPFTAEQQEAVRKSVTSPSVLMFSHKDC